MASDVQLAGDGWTRRRLKGIGGGRKWGGSDLAATPFREWKLRGRDSAGGGAVAAVSARKLAASLWKLAATTGGNGNSRWRRGLFDRLQFEVCSSKFAMEGVTKWDFCDSNPCEDLSYYFCNMKPTSVASARKVEFSKAKTNVNELDEVEASCSTRKIKHSMKKTNEERESWIRTEHQRMCSVAKNLADDVKRERKKSEKIGVMNSKLLSDIREAKLSAKKFMDNLEKEKKAKRLLEDECNELVEEIQGNKAEIGELRNQRERIREEVEDERKMLQLAGVWQEEQAQMQLHDAKLAVEDKLHYINDMITELEAFLRKANLTTDVDAQQVSQRSETSGVSSVSLKQSRKKESSPIFKVKTALSRNRDTTKSESSIITSDSPKRVLSGGGVSVRRNPHVNRAMKGQIEWPRGVRREGLAPKLLEDRLEGQKMLMRTVLKQRS